MALDYSVIGERIRKMRVEKNLTQENLSEKLNVSVAFISRIERGTTRVNLKRISEICSILDVDEGYLLNGTSVESKSYLIDEFNNILKNCSSQKQKLIYDIARIIVNSEEKE